MSAISRILLDPRRPFAIERFGRTAPPQSWLLDGRRIREHLLYFVLEGTLHAEAGVVRGAFPAGSLVFIPRGTVHTVRFEPGGRGMFYHLRFTAGRAFRPAPAAAAGCAHFRTYLDDMFLESRRPQPDPLRIRAYLYVLLTGLAGAGQTFSGNPERLLTDTVKRRCIRYIADRLTGTVDIGGLAAEAGYNRSYFTRLFKLSFGLPPRLYVSREKILASQNELRETSMPVGEIAAYYGFADIYHYSKQFRKYCGVSPRAYRLRVQGVRRPG